jgi:AcrR family transcriptional regulator
MRAKHLDSDTRREQIAEAALTLIAGQGMASVTVERVARLTGLTPSGLYRHFKNKAEILDAVLNLVHDRFLDSIQAAREGTPTPLDALHRLLLRHVRMIMAQHGIPRILFSDEINFKYPEKKATLRDIMTDFLAGITALMAKGQKEGTIRSDIPAKDMAVMFIGIFQPPALLYFLSDGSFDLLAQVDTSWRLFAETISTRNTLETNVAQRTAQ